MKRLVILVVALIVVVAPVFAVELTTQKDGDTYVLAVHVSGKQTKTGLDLELQLGPVATRSVDVYSEPSHTLLLRVVDYELSSAGNLPAPPSVAIVTDLPQTETITIPVATRPFLDDRVAVWIDGLWPDGTVESRIVADGKVGNGDFGYTRHINVDPEAKSGSLTCCDTDCCSGSVCGNCGPFRFTCCASGEPGCCWITCDFVVCDCICCPDIGCSKCYVLPHSCY